MTNHGYNPGSPEETAYKKGYADGRNRTHLQLRAHEQEQHDLTECHCDPCETLREVLANFLQEPIDQILAREFGPNDRSGMGF